MQGKAKQLVASVPMRVIGPIRIKGPEVNDDVMVPLASFETPVWPSTARGAKVAMACGGIEVVIMADIMTRSVLLEATSAVAAVERWQNLQTRQSELAEVVAGTSRFATLESMHAQVVGNLLFVRLEVKTGDAAGHNMVTGAAEAALSWILDQYADLKYVSISGNYCTDKKASAVNGILGRGKYVIAELLLTRDVCKSMLRTTPEQIVELNMRKNLLGTSLAGTVRSANAHFANMLLALYLATGQDAANIIEGSQGYTLAELREDALAFSVTLPNIILGTVGNGKDLPFVHENMAILGCDAEREPGANARRLAIICAATVLCGELSLLAAQTNPGELMRAHRRLERPTHD